MSRVKSKWMTTTALSVAFLSAAGAWAQDAQPSDGTNIETVLVTGYRESLQKALDLKRNAVDSEDSIVAEDIAAFPDLNLAELMQRIPGVAITRDAGEGRQIVLRGLGPDFTRTQLNGMEVLSNTASGMDNRGNVSRTRSFDFSLFASELFDKVTVQKSYDAQQDEGGIAGTVELYTAKPFDYDSFKAVLSAKGIVNTNTQDVTPRVVGLISDRWGAFGALLTVAYRLTMPTNTAIATGAGARSRSSRPTSARMFPPPTRRGLKPRVRTKSMRRRPRPIRPGSPVASVLASRLRSNMCPATGSTSALTCCSAS